MKKGKEKNLRVRLVELHIALNRILASYKSCPATVRKISGYALHNDIRGFEIAFNIEKAQHGLEEGSQRRIKPQDRD